MKVGFITFAEVGAQPTQELEILTVSKLDNKIGLHLQISCKVGGFSLVFNVPASSVRLF